MKKRIESIITILDNKKAEDIRRYLEIKTIEEATIKNLLHELNDEGVIFTGRFYFYSIVKRWLTHLNLSDFSTIIKKILT